MAIFVTCSLGLAPEAIGTPLNAFEVRRLVSDLPGADYLDPNLQNPWGLALSPTGPFWVANNGTGTSTVYNGQGQPQPQPTPLVVSIRNSATSVPTGAVFNDTPDAFSLEPGRKAQFLFSTEQGAITGWNPLINPTLTITPFQATDGAVYKGLALGNNGSGDFLYAPDFANGKIDVLDASFALTSLPGNFLDPNLPAGYVPFNVQNIGGKLYVTYARQNGSDDLPGPGNGLISVFDLNGNFEKRLVSGGALNSPWGLAQAPADFGPFAGDLLVGNFGDGRINVYDLLTGDYVDTLSDKNGQPITNEGLWALKFGNGGSGGDPSALYFTAGIDDESHGLFGRITLSQANGSPVPDAGSTLTLLLPGALTLLVVRRGHG